MIEKGITKEMHDKMLNNYVSSLKKDKEFMKKLEKYIREELKEFSK